MTDHPPFVQDKAKQLFADLWALEDWEKSKPEVIEMICEALRGAAEDGMNLVHEGLKRAANVKS